MHASPDDIGEQIAKDPESGYNQLRQALESLIAGERNLIANLANASALLYANLTSVNWVGFYLYDGHELVVGPFQGRPACVRIALGRGVCGTAAQTGRTLLVPDVHTFPGHIACDAASNAELVVPMLQGTRLLGVLDIDSPLKNRFRDSDARGIETLVQTLIGACVWPE